jgi:hypothetical protein
MLESQPGADEAGYQALAIVEALIDVLVDRDILSRKERFQVLSLAVEKLSKGTSSVRNDAGRLIADAISRHQKLE